MTEGLPSTSFADSAVARGSHSVGPYLFQSMAILTRFIHAIPLALRLYCRNASILRSLPMVPAWIALTVVSMSTRWVSISRLQLWFQVRTSVES